VTAFYIGDAGRQRALMQPLGLAEEPRAAASWIAGMAATLVTTRALFWTLVMEVGVGPSGARQGRRPDTATIAGP
jgi:hypothetical protein